MEQKAILFLAGFGLLLGRCRFGHFLWRFPRGNEYGSGYGCENDERCRSYPMGSLYAYPEKIKFPACKVIPKGDTFLELNYSEATSSLEAT
jgi:hypothetical protein